MRDSTAPAVLPETEIAEFIHKYNEIIQLGRVEI